MQPEGIHILIPDGTVLRSNIGTLKAARALARRLSRGGQQVMLVDPRGDYRRLYVNGYHDKRRRTRAAAIRDSTLAPVAPVAREDHSDWTDLVEALGDRTRAVPTSAFSANGPAQARCGVYAWWADETARSLIEETLVTEAGPLVYVGKASNSLATRVLGTHLNGSIRNSTLRWSLTAILMATTAFAARHSDPCVVRGSPTLSAWMREHLEVAIIAVDPPESVEDVERAMIARYDPPLNLRGVERTPARARLRELRRQLKPVRDADNC